MAEAHRVVRNNIVDHDGNVRFKTVLIDAETLLIMVHHKHYMVI